MRSRRLLWLPFLAVLALALVAAACGGEEEEGVATPTGVPTAAVSPTPPGPSPTPGAAPVAETVEIAAIPSITFDTDTITVSAGSQVSLRFMNDDSGIPHNWAAYTDSDATELLPGAITEICSGDCSEEITFTAPTEPGTYYFRCDVHPTVMTGSFVVE